MNEEQKAELRAQIETLINGLGYQTQLALAILSLARHANDLYALAVAAARRGKFSQSDPIFKMVADWSEKVELIHRKPEDVNRRRS